MIICRQRMSCSKQQIRGWGIRETPVDARMSETFETFELMGFGDSMQ